MTKSSVIYIIFDNVLIPNNKSKKLQSYYLLGILWQISTNY